MGGSGPEGTRGCDSALPWGPIAEPADALYVLDRVPLIDGFYGASSLERLPVEEALSVRVREFVALRRSGGGYLDSAF